MIKYRNFKIGNGQFLLVFLILVIIIMSITHRIVFGTPWVDSPTSVNSTFQVLEVTSIGSIIITIVYYIVDKWDV